MIVQQQCFHLNVYIRHKLQENFHCSIYICFLYFVKQTFSTYSKASTVQNADITLPKVNSPFEVDKLNSKL